MTCEEFSNEFDTLLNSYNQAVKFKEQAIPGSLELDEYEKSICLTQAQEELIIEFYSGKNPFRDSVEKTEEVGKYLSKLIKDHETSNTTSYLKSISNYSYFYTLPTDVWFILYESVTFSDTALGSKNGTTVKAKPITHDTFFSFQRNPFKGMNENKVLRLSLNENTVEIISKYDIGTYFVRYIEQPSPIVLVDLPELTINGIGDKTECELNPVLHRSILKRAVQIALNRFNVAGN